MEIGVIGLNQNAYMLCKHWLKGGHKIFFADLHLYSKNYAIAESLGPNVTLSPPDRAARKSEFIVLAVASRKIATAVRQLGDIQQKIVVDLVNEDYRQPNESTFNQIQLALPEAKVVKLTNDYPLNILYPKSEGSKVLYSYSNDRLAQRLVNWSIAGSGYKMIDLENIIDLTQK